AAPSCATLARGYLHSSPSDFFLLLTMTEIPLFSAMASDVITRHKATRVHDAPAPPCTDDAFGVEFA
ncbi:MAG: hypothetical protein LBF85_10875, partial [Tannerella sp.]|nr:hypothetical protein [Tannerella sp.]